MFWWLCNLSLSGTIVYIVRTYYSTITQNNRNFPILMRSLTSTHEIMCNQKETFLIFFYLEFFHSFEQIYEILNKKKETFVIKNEKHSPLTVNIGQVSIKKRSECLLVGEKVCPSNFKIGIQYYLYSKKDESSFDFK